MKRIGRFLLPLWWFWLSELSQFWLSFTLFLVSCLALLKAWWTPLAGWCGVLLALAGFGCAFLEGKRRLRIATSSVATLEPRLIGRALPRGGFSVGSVFWYGAVHVSPEHCVVWLLLRGDETQLPPYLQAEGLPEVADEPLREWLNGLHAEALAIFRSQGWHWSWPPPKVGFEFESRASWDHFR